MALSLGMLFLKKKGDQYMETVESVLRNGLYGRPVPRTVVPPPLLPPSSGLRSGTPPPDDDDCALMGKPDLEVLLMTVFQFLVVKHL